MCNFVVKKSLIKKIATENTEDTEFFSSVLSVFSVAKKLGGKK